MSEDLAAFLNARLDEDEAAATAAAASAGPDWHPSSAVTAAGATTIVFCGRDDDIEVADTLRRHDEEIAPFIARQDPARALREVEAKRAILKRHRPGHASYGPLEGGLYCEAASSDEDLWYAKRWPCLDLRILAAIWDDHPDYREEWKPWATSPSAS
jgi:Family of unknown function (DUF6221)